MRLCDILTYSLFLVLGILGMLPLIIMSLIINPIVISRNSCDNIYLPLGLWIYLLIGSCVTIGLSIVAALHIIFRLNRPRSSMCTKVFWLCHGVIFYLFQLGWACVAGWLIFGNGPAASCYSYAIGKTVIANFVAQILSVTFGLFLWQIVWQLE